MPDEQWYAIESGEQRGPFTRGQLGARLGDGAPVALVWREGMTGWAPPRDVAELRAAAAVSGARLPRSSTPSARSRGPTARRCRASGDTHHFDTMQADLTVRVSCDVGRARRTRRSRSSGSACRIPSSSIRREDGLDRAGKRLGIDREVQTDDDALDRAAYFETALPAPAVRDIVGRPGFRQRAGSLAAARLPTGSPRRGRARRPRCRWSGPTR